MENIYRNDSDSVENNVRRTLREWEESPPSDWDTPPAALWDKIAAATPPPPAATGIVWWKWLCGAVLVLGLTAGSLWWLNSSSTPEKQTPAAVQTPLMAEKTGQPDAGLRPEPVQPSLPGTPAPAPVLQQNDQQQVAHIADHAASTQTPQPTRRKPKPVVSETGQAFADESNNNASATANTRFSDVSSPSVTEQTGIGESHLLPVLSETPTAVENPGTATPWLALWSPVEALALPLPALLPTSELPVAMAAVSPAKRTPKSGHVYAGLMLASNHTFRQIQSDRPIGQLPAFLRENESASWTTEYGVRVGWQPNRRLALSLGAGQYNMSQQSRHRFRIPFDPGRERPTTNNNFESNYNLSVPSSYGDANVEVGVQRPGNQPLLPGQFLNVETRTQINLRYISLPLTATYFLHTSPRWSVGVKGGVALSVLDKQDFTATSTISLRGLRSRTITVQRQAPDIEKTMADYQLGAALWYRPAPGWTVSVEPTYRHSIGTVLERGDYSVSQYAWGVQLGVQKSF